MKNSDMPAVPVWCNNSDQQLYGLTKREVFAMHAMQAMLTSDFAVNFNGDTFPDENDTICERAVHYADALLKELEK